MNHDLTQDLISSPEPGYSPFALLALLWNGNRSCLSAAKLTPRKTLLASMAESTPEPEPSLPEGYVHIRSAVATVLACGASLRTTVESRV